MAIEGTARFVFCGRRKESEDNVRRSGGHLAAMVLLFAARVAGAEWSEIGSGLPRAIAANQGDNVALLDFKGDAVQR